MQYNFLKAKNGTDGPNVVKVTTVTGPNGRSIQSLTFIDASKTSHPEWVAYQAWLATPGNTTGPSSALVTPRS